MLLGTIRSYVVTGALEPVFGVGVVEVPTLT